MLETDLKLKNTEDCTDQTIIQELTEELNDPENADLYNFDDQQTDWKKGLEEMKRRLLEPINRKIAATEKRLRETEEKNFKYAEETMMKYHNRGPASKPGFRKRFQQDEEELLSILTTKRQKSTYNSMEKLKFSLSKHLDRL